MNRSQWLEVWICLIEILFIAEFYQSETLSIQILIRISTYQAFFSKELDVIIQLVN